ncbi:MAG TPA: pitrilysin family protein [Polyangia bacterium]|jgi:Predicted Zn-dependent peptidases|nr:pitrilysin family protein [Polyangia bacterium]
MAFLFRIAASATLLLCLAPPVRAATPEVAFEKYRLPNGLDVILHVDHAVPIVHVEVWYKVGSKDEAPGKTGFAHLFEHMMFQGTKHIPEDAYFKYLGQAGASARNGSTSTDRTNYFETLPSSELELGLWLESSRMGFLLDRPWSPETRDDQKGNPTRPGSLRATLGNQRDVVKNERRQRIENAPLGGVARVELEALFPPGHPYHHEVMGSMKDLDAASEADIRGFFNRNYAPNNAVLLIAGDLDVAQVKGLVDKYFGPIPAGPAVQRQPVPPIPAATGERRIPMEAKINLARGVAAWNTVACFAPGDAELDLLANVLGGGKSSRLHRRLVLELKIAQSVSAVHISRLLGGTFEISYVPLQGHTLAELETAINQELEKLRAQPVTAAELERARNEIKTDLVRSLDTLQGLAGHLLTYDVFAGDPAYLDRDVARYEAATPEVLQKWAAQILRDKARVTIDVEPNSKAPIMGRLVSPAPGKDQPVTAAPVVGNPTARQTPDAEFRHKLPAAGEKTPFKVPEVKRFRLKNGLRVILAESHKLPLVGVEMVVRTGNGANPRDKSGLADLVADMLDEGTATRSATQIAEEIAQLGATLSTNATWDASSLSVSALSENIDRALDVWADVLLRPAFSDGDLARVRENLLSTLARRKDSPPLVAGLTFARALYGENHPYGWPLGGTEDSVRRISRADVQNFYQAFYRPNNAVLVVAGDIREAELRAQMEKRLAGWKPKPARILMPKPPLIDRTRIFLVDKTGAPQSSIRLGLFGIERKNPDYYRALVMNQILGGTFKRLTLNLRETKGWTYGVASMFEARRAPGPWTVGGEFVANHTADSVTEILKEISALRSDEVGEREMKDTKDEIIRAFPARFATANQVAAQMGALAVYDLPDKELQTFTARIASVTAADVRKMAQKYLRPDHMVIVVVGDRTSIEASLRRIGEVELRDLDGAPIK